MYCMNYLLVLLKKNQVRDLTRYLLTTNSGDILINLIDKYLA